MYKQIRPLAFKLVSDSPSLTREFYRLRFPVAWKTVFRDLRIAGSNRPVDPQKVTIPIRSLNKALRTLVPDIISVLPSAAMEGTSDWLFATAAMDPQVLRLIVQGWMQAEFKKAPADKLRLAMKQIDQEPLVWQQQTYKLSDWTVTEGGTARETAGVAYNLLPEVIASMLSKPGTPLVVDGVPFSLVRCPIAPGGSGAELVSWPPFYVDDEKKSGPHSLLVSITLQTVPFEPEPLVYVDLGVRRWVDATDLKGKFRGHVQVYLRTAVPWLASVGQTHSFQMGRVRWRRMDGPEGAEPKFCLAWGDGFGEIISWLNPNHPMLDPEWLRQHINQGFVADNGTNAAFAYNTRMEGSHLAGAGLMPADRHPLFEALIQALDGTLTPEKSYPRSKIRLPQPSTDLYNFKKSDATQCAQRRQALLRDVGPRVSFEIFYQRDDTPQAIGEALCSFLGLPNPTRDDEHWTLDGLSVELRCQPLGALGDSLALDAEIKNKTDQAMQAMQDRIGEVRQRLKTVQYPTLAIIELDGKGAYSSTAADPKSALRSGFAQTGRVTQFVSASTDQSAADRARMILLDGLRQLGMLPKLDHVTAVKGHLEGMNYVGIWIVKQRTKAGRNDDARYIPVLVHVDSQTGQVKAKACGFEEWCDYREALLRLGHGGFQSFDRMQQTQGFILETLQELAAEERPHLVICDAHNIRQAWRGMQNQHIQKDKVSVDAVTYRPVTEFPGLRIVRMRGNQSHETPEWYGYEEGNGSTESKIGFAQGLFEVNERVFCSNGSKPVQFKKLSPKMSKFFQNEGRHTSPRTASWNPTFYEISVAAMQPGDVAEVLAAVTNQLRLSSIQYEEATALASPLHLAALMNEYILTAPEEEDEE